MLKDTFGRVHDYLRISLTEKCNLRCTYCMPADGVPLTPKDQLMTADEINVISKKFVQLGVNKIRLTGGEPLVRKDFRDILYSLKKTGVDISITTNGLLVDRYIDDFEKVGMGSVNVSLDSLDEKKFFQITRMDKFQKVMSNIELLLDRGFHVKLNVVATKGFNDDEIVDFIGWTRSKNIHVRFIEFMPFEGNKWNLSKVLSYKDILQSIESKYEIEKLSDHPNSTAKAYRIAGYVGTFAVISSVTDHFCGSCNRLRLTADGKMKNCLFSKGEADLLGTLRKGEDIVPIVQKCLLNKHFKHGGIKDIERVEENGAELSDRSMILIGG